MANLENFNRVASCTFPDKLKADDLTINHPYQILVIKKVNTEFGLSVVVEIPNGSIFLPKRLTSTVTDAMINEISSKKNFYLTYKGK